MQTIMGKFRDEYLKEVGDTYQNHVNKFIFYLNTVDKLNTPKFININDVANSVGYYAKRRKINYRASMESHLESIKSFYDYLSEKGKEHDIFVQMNYEKFKDELCERFQLSEGVERESFPMEIVIEILSKLDKVLEMDYDSIVGTRNKDRYSQRTVLRLFIKLTLIAPAKRKVMCDIIKRDFADDYRTIMINGVTINIPNGLRRDLISAIKFVEDKSEKFNDNDKLFHYVYTGKFENEALNSWFCTFLKEMEIIDIEDAKNSYVLEPIMMTAIESMVNRMANPALISKISGVRIARLENKYYNKENNLMEYKKTVDQAINWEIAKSEYYNYI